MGWALLLGVMAGIAGGDHGLAGPAPGEATSRDGMITGAWAAEVLAGLTREEYRVADNFRGEVPAVAHEPLQAPNRAQGFRSLFSPRGPRLVPRDENQPGWDMLLSLSRIGRGERVWPVAPAWPLVEGGHSVSYMRGDIHEWYSNDRRGLEQGFVIGKPPDPGAARRAPLHLDLAVDGSLRPVVARAGAIIHFADVTGRAILRYSDLHAWDATGRELPASMEIGAQGGGAFVRLVVDDRHATYPVVIDPLAASADWTAESDQLNAGFGFSVSSAGDVNDDLFGDVVVGAPGFDTGTTDGGKVFLYLGSASGLSITPAWTAQLNQFETFFGYSVAGVGDVNLDGHDDIVVGAPGVTSGSPDEGKAFLYLGNLSGLETTAAWTAESNQALAEFGKAVAGAGDVNGDGFDDVLIGAPLFDGGSLDEGRAFLYLGTSTGLTTTAAWTAESNQTGALFGGALGGAGDVNGDGFDDVIVGAPLNNNGQPEEGRASVYLGSGAGLDTTAHWVVESDQIGAQLGFAVGTAGDVNGDGFADVAVGAPFFTAGASGAGRVFVFHGSAGGLTTAVNWIADGEQADAHLGWSLAGGGDVNGDGFGDLLVGAPDFDAAFAGEGRVLLFQGSVAGLRAAPDGSSAGGQAGAGFGAAVGMVRDVNLDQLDDVLIGAPGFANGQAGEGRAFLYHGSPAGGCLDSDDDGDGLTGCGGDNCPVVSNPQQEDFDADGIGDACETGAVLADIDHSLRVDGFDLARLSRVFGRISIDPLYDAEADLDRNDSIDGQDLAILALHFGEPVP